MNPIAQALAKYIAAHVAAPAEAVPGSSPIEVRLIFHGPPLEILSEVFDRLVTGAKHSVEEQPPFLLQVPRDLLRNDNPGIGQSGWCDETHLLDLRNLPVLPSFVALIPPGQHSILSVSSTTDKFGVAEANNSGNATFESWWDDAFVQHLVLEGLNQAGVREASIEEGRLLVEAAARAADEVDDDRSSRRGAWRVLSRLFTIPSALAIQSGFGVSLACGVPPRRDGSLSARDQLATLDKIADALSDGFRNGIDRLVDGASQEESEALEAFLVHVRTRCQVQTTFDRATAAYYAPMDGLTVASPPEWWGFLDAEKWSELLSEELAASGDIVMTCMNSIADLGKALPAVVLDKVDLSFSTKGGEPSAARITVERTPAGGAKVVGEVDADGDNLLSDTSPPSHKNPISYKAMATGFKPGSMKVVSLATWQPGILVGCRLARKYSGPRKPSKSARGAADWETSLTLPGPGRYELLVFVSPGVELELTASGIADQADGRPEAPTAITVRPLRGPIFQAEVEADGNYQVDFNFSKVMRDGSTEHESCRVFVTCEDIPEIGCRSEFERLIRANRRQLEAFDARAEIQLNRSVRSTMLQDWILAPEMVRQSYQPIVLAEDYGAHWAPPRWGEGGGPLMSAGSFICDPRPSPQEFEPPEAFLSAREDIAKRIRGDGDQSGVFETARLGEWISRDDEFKAVVEQYVDSYSSWLAAAPEIACWCDVIAVASLDGSGRSLSRVPDAIILSPFHPLRLGWHAVAQEVLLDADELGRPCPAASVLDPDCIPDIISMYVRSPSGVNQTEYLAVENGTDYWSVLWNGSGLANLPLRSLKAPFGAEFGVSVGGISVGFSAAQVVRALDDVSELLAAKPVISIAVSSAGGSTDACNEGLLEWCTARFQEDAKRPRSRATGQRFIEVFDERKEDSRPDDAKIANLSEDTQNAVRWFAGQPSGSNPDLGIIAQLDMSEPGIARVEHRTPLGFGALARHRIRRQLQIFLSESRQSTPAAQSGDVLADKVAGLTAAIENLSPARLGLQFAPNVHEVRHMLHTRRTDFVAVSSSAVDPACFLGGWLEGAYLWDYELPSYSHRSGDTNGYYLLSQVSDADREALAKALARLPGCERIEPAKVKDVLLEVARRGIPTIKGLAGDDAGATGDLGVLVGARLLQDKFRVDREFEGGVLPILAGSQEQPAIALVIPVDPFRSYIGDLCRTIGKDRKDVGLLRPDLVVVGIDFQSGAPRIKITPVEVKCRPNAAYGSGDAAEALGQAKAFSSLLAAMAPHAGQPRLWNLAFQHLVLSIIGFGMRVYSQQSDALAHPGRWSELHEQIAKAILDGGDCIEVDGCGRLIVVDDSHSSLPRDHDNDGFHETIVIGREDAGRIVAGDPSSFYDMVHARVGDWNLMPSMASASSGMTAVGEPASASVEESNGVASSSGEANPQPSLGFEPRVPADSVAIDTHAFPGCGPQEGGSGIILNVGRTVDGFKPRELSLNISDTKLNQLNMGVVGDLGTGKTQLLKSLIAQISGAGPCNRGIKPRFLIFDYKRDYSSDDFVAATGARVVRPHRLPLNLFDTRTIGDVPTPWLDRFRFFADVLGKIYPGIGPVQRDKLKRAVREAYEHAPSGTPPTLRDVHSAYSTILDGKSDSPMAIIDDLIDMEIFEPDQSRIVPFDKFLDGVVVVSLDALGQDDHSKNMLVAVMLNMFYENMLKTPKRPFIGTDPQLRAIDSYLLVDEADNIMRYEFDVLRKLLLQGREFGTGVILASQYLRHFKAGATDYREPLLTWFIHKVPNVTSAELAALGLASNASEIAERVKTLGNHQCLYKSFDVPGEIVRGFPFFEFIRTRTGGEE
ncbi:ATP-binding protein [Rhizobium leguminosarum]